MSYCPFYLEIRGVVTIDRPLHLGGAAPWHPLTDSPILRKNGEMTGDPILPGSSLKGLLKAHLARERCLLGCDQATFKRLFGLPVDADSPYSAMGRLRIHDAVRTSSGISGVVRDHVRIDPVTGAAAHQAKFDEEVTPSEAEFSFLAIYEGETQDDPELVLLHEAVRALQSGELRAGAKAGWGYGRLRLVHPEYRCFQRDQPAGLKDFLAYRLNPASPGTSSFTWPPTPRLIPSADTGPLSSFEFTILLQFEGPMLVKSAIPPKPASQEGFFTADHIFLSESGRYYLPGSSLRGVLRHRAGQICHSQNLGEELVAELFGTAKDTNGDEESGRRGRLEVGDALADEAVPIFLDHVAIDRITSFAAIGRKFAHQALESPSFRAAVRVLAEPEKPLPLALWMLLLRDLCDGRLWCGSGTTRGYGKLRSSKIESFSANVVTNVGLPQPPRAEEAAAPDSRPFRTSFKAAAVEWNGPALHWLFQPLDDAWGRNRRTSR